MNTFLLLVNKIQIILYLIFLSSTSFANQVPYKKVSTGVNFFDPDGYYLPIREEVIFNKFQLVSMNIHSLEYYYNGVLNYADPHFVKPKIILSIKKLNSKKNYTVNCSNTKIVDYKIKTTCYLEGVGSFSIYGTFADKGGQFWNREDIVPKQTIVLNADIVFDKKKLEWPIAFTYETGH